MYIFTKFHKDWTIIVDFLLIDKFLASPDNYASPSSSAMLGHTNLVVVLDMAP